jgi:hypothetical protein
MPLHRNLGPTPIDLPDGRQLFVGDDLEMSAADLAHPGVAPHVEQGTLAPVTMAPTAKATISTLAE